MPIRVFDIRRCYYYFHLFILTTPLLRNQTPIYQRRFEAIKSCSPPPPPWNVDLTEDASWNCQNGVFSSRFPKYIYVLTLPPSDYADDDLGEIQHNILYIMLAFTRSSHYVFLFRKSGGFFFFYSNLLIIIRFNRPNMTFVWRGQWKSILNIGRVIVFAGFKAES